MEATQDLALADKFYMRLGDVYDHMGNFEEAAQLFKKSVEIGQKDPNNRTWYKSFLSYLRTLTQLGKYKEAIDYLKKTSRTISS